MSGRYSRNKGARGEREIVNLLKKYGFDAQRISPMETGGIDKGDVRLGTIRCEVKVGDQVPSFVYTARKAGEEILFLKRDRMGWLVCMDLEEYIDLKRSFDGLCPRPARK